MAEEAKGRRNRIGTVLITPVVQPEPWPTVLDEGDRALPPDASCSTSGTRFRA